MLKTSTKPSLLTELRNLISLLEKENLTTLSLKDRKELDDLLKKDIPRLIDLIKSKEK